MENKKKKKATKRENPFLVDHNSHIQIPFFSKDFGWGGVPDNTLIRFLGGFYPGYLSWNHSTSIFEKCIRLHWVSVMVAAALHIKLFSSTC